MNNNQGKSKNQINFSSRMAFVAFIGLILCFIWAIAFLPDPSPPTEGIPHNYYVPTIWGHDTINDDMLDIDMDCGDDILRFNQIHYDSIPRYVRFTDVPAGTDTIIIVDEILYMVGSDKTAWTPIYPDEYVMWVSNNGDTIWE